MAWPRRGRCGTLADNPVCSGQTASVDMTVTSQFDSAFLILLRLPEVCRRTGYSRSEVYRRVHAGTFPAPISSASVRRRGPNMKYPLGLPPASPSATLRRLHEHRNGKPP